MRNKGKKHKEECGYNKDKEVYNLGKIVAENDFKMTKMKIKIKLIY